MTAAGNAKWGRDIPQRRLQLLRRHPAHPAPDCGELLMVLKFPDVGSRQATEDGIQMDAGGNPRAEPDANAGVGPVEGQVVEEPPATETEIRGVENDHLSAGAAAKPGAVPPKRRRRESSEDEPRRRRRRRPHRDSHGPGDRGARDAQGGG